MKKARIIIGLQVVFLIGALIFVTSKACHNINIHGPTIALDRFWEDALKKDAFDEKRLKDKTSADAQIFTAAEAFKGGKTPADVRARLDDIDGLLVGAKTEVGDAAFVVAHGMPVKPIRGLKHRPNMSEVAGVNIFGVTKEFVDSLIKPSSAGRLAEVPELVVERPPTVGLDLKAAEALKTLQPRAEGLVISPPPAGQIPTLFAMITKALGEESRELTPTPAPVELIRTPAEVKTWEGAFGKLEFNRPVFYRGTETTSVEAVTTALGEFAEEFAAPEAITAGPHRRAVATFAYPGLYLREGDMKYAAEEGAVYTIEAVPPITIGGEAVKTKGRVSTHAILIRPINEPVLVLVSEHVTAEGEVFLFPEAEKLTSAKAMELAGKELLESPVVLSHIIVVKGPFVIPAGVPHSIVGLPTGKMAFIERLASAEQKTLPEPYQTPSQILHGGPHRIMREEARGGISIEANPAYPAYYEEAPLYRGGIAEFPPIIGESLYRLIIEKQLKTTKLGELLREGKISQPPTELAAYAQRGALVYKRFTIGEEFPSAVGMPVALKAASAGIVIEISEGGVSMLKKGQKTTKGADLAVTKVFLQELGVDLVHVPVETPEEAAKYLAEKLKPEVLGKIAEFAKKLKAAPPAEGKEAVISGIKEVGEAMVELPTGGVAAVVTLPEGKIGLQVIPTKRAAAVIEREAFKPTEIEKLKKSTRHQIVISDLDTWVVQQGTKDAKPVYAPAVHAITTIANLNRTQRAKLHLGIISNKFSTSEVINILQQAGLPVSLFAGIYGDVTNAKAMTDVVGKMKTRLEDAYQTEIANSDIIFSIAEANKALLNALNRAKLGVLVQTIMAPKKGWYISQKDSLIAAVKALSLNPKVKQNIIDAIHRAEKIQPVEATKEDKYESIEEMRDMLLENV